MQTDIFSRIKCFLPTQSPASARDDIEPLKDAHFMLFKLVTVCYISSINPPLIPALKDENQAIEKRESLEATLLVRTKRKIGGI
jgi:protein phosphatase 1 regulatory subunit 37